MPLHSEVRVCAARHATMAVRNVLARMAIGAGTSGHRQTLGAAQGKKGDLEGWDADLPRHRSPSSTRGAFRARVQFRVHQRAFGGGGSARDLLVCSAGRWREAPSTASGTLSHESARASYLGDGHRATGSHDPRRRRIDECRDGVPERGCFLNDRRRILCAAANRIMKVHPSTGPAHGCASSHADDGRPLAWAVAIGCDTASCASRQHRRDQEPGDRATCADEKHR